MLINEAEELVIAPIIAPFIAAWNLELFKMLTADPSLLITEVAMPTRACIPISLKNSFQFTLGLVKHWMIPEIPAEVIVLPATKPIPGMK